MGTQLVSFSSALSRGTIPMDYRQDSDDGNTFGTGATFHISTEDLMSGFVDLLEENPKVWAVAASGDPSGISVSTYIDSTDRSDRRPVYEAEWELMTRYPDVPFDFSTILAPVATVSLERGHYTYLHLR
jgi:hypothetical protein